MKKQLFKLFLIAVSLTMMSNCKKYPKGGFSNKAYKNLSGEFGVYFNKAWKVKTYRINGVDSTSSFKPTNISGFVNSEFNKHDVLIRGGRSKNEFFVSTEYFEFKAKLNDDKTQILFDPSGEDFKLPVRCDTKSSIKECEKNIFYPESWRKENLKWKILQLTKDYFWITARGNFSYEILLTYVED